MRFVPYKDRDVDVNILRVALNGVGINVSYFEAELVDTVVKMVADKGGDITMKDLAKVHSDWIDKWEPYFKAQAQGEDDIEDEKKE